LFGIARASGSASSAELPARRGAADPPADETSTSKIKSMSKSMIKTQRKRKIKRKRTGVAHIAGGGNLSAE
jgi:hypothetical protein